MADVGNGAPEVISSSPIGKIARRQYSALMWMRLRMLMNSVRSVHGAFELSARGIAFGIYTLMGLSLGFGLGAGAFSLISNHHYQYLGALFWVVFAVWQVLPIALASFQEQFDLSNVLRFPLSFSTFCVLSLTFGLVDVPAILGGICCVGIWAGVTLARPDLAGLAAAVLAVFAAFNILLGRTVFAWVDKWLAKRRTREIVSALFLMFMLSLQLLNPALRSGAHYQRPNQHTANANQQKYANEIKPWLKTGSLIEPWLPPGLAADALVGSSEPLVERMSISFGVLGLYILATGALLVVRLRAEYRGERLSDTPAERKKTADDSQWLIDGSGPIAAVVEKELRIIPRSMPLLFAMGAPLLTVLVISTVLRNTSESGRPVTFAFPLCVCYALLGFTQMIFNNLGSEGTGIQMLFLSPTPIRSVLLAKNLIHGALFCIVATLAALFAMMRLGEPDLNLLITTAAWVLFALPANMAAGNVLSVTMPYRVNLGRLSRQRGSQASALVSMLIQAMVIGCGVVVMELCNVFKKSWLSAPVMLLLAGIACVVWFRVLAHADSLAQRNRDNLIATLAKVE